MMTFYRRLCAFLDWLYTFGGVLVSLFLIAILLLIVAQMIARWTGLVFSDAADYAGYCMASASLLAFAHALNWGAHIRVSILLNALGKGRYWLEIWCFTIGALSASYLAWYAVRATQWSHKFNDISQGQDATPLWIPQMGMSVGAVLLAICFWDNVVRFLVLKLHAIRSESVA